MRITIESNGNYKNGNKLAILMHYSNDNCVLKSLKKKLNSLLMGSIRNEKLLEYFSTWATYDCFSNVDSKLCVSYMFSSEAVQFIYKPGGIILNKG